MPRKKWPTFADCLRDAEDKIHQQAEKKLALVCTFVEIKFNALNRRVDLHAIDATPARWRGGASYSPLDRQDGRVTHWLISTQVRTAEQDLEREQQAFSSSSPGDGPSMYLRQIPTGTEVIDVEAEGLEVVEVD